MPPLLPKPSLPCMAASVRSHPLQTSTRSHGFTNWLTSLPRFRSVFPSLQAAVPLYAAVASQARCSCEVEYLFTWPLAVPFAPKRLVSSRRFLDVAGVQPVTGRGRALRGLYGSSAGEKENLADRNDMNSALLLTSTTVCKAQWRVERSGSYCSCFAGLHLDPRWVCALGRVGEAMPAGRGTANHGPLARHQSTC